MYQVSLSRVIFEKLTELFLRNWQSYFRFIYRNDHVGHVSTKCNLELSYNTQQNWILKVFVCMSLF